MKSVKTHPKRIVSPVKLTFEELIYCFKSDLSLPEQPSFASSLDDDGIAVLTLFDKQASHSST